MFVASENYFKSLLIVSKWLNLVLILRFLSLYPRFQTTFSKETGLWKYYSWYQNDKKDSNSSSVFLWRYESFTPGHESHCSSYYFQVLLHSVKKSLLIMHFISEHEFTFCVGGLFSLYAALVWAKHIFRERTIHGLCKINFTVQCEFGLRGKF